MGTISETVWVNTFDEFRATIDRYIAEGGVVREQEPGATTLFVEKKMNVVVLVVGLLLCLVPGLAYLGWYLWADKDQLVTVRMGKPDNIGGYQPGGEPVPEDLPEYAASAEQLTTPIPPATAPAPPTGTVPPPQPPSPPSPPSDPADPGTGGF